MSEYQEKPTRRQVFNALASVGIGLTASPLLSPLAAAEVSTGMTPPPNPE